MPKQRWSLDDELPKDITQRDQSSAGAKSQFDLDRFPGADLTEKLSKLIFLAPGYKDFHVDGEVKHFTWDWFKKSGLEILEVERKSDVASRIAFRFELKRHYLNPNMQLHGGWTASLFDICTSWLLLVISKEGFWRTTGSTRTLNVTYLRPANEHEFLRLECDTVHVGKRLALLKGTLMRDSDRAIIATCEHNKFNTDAPKI